MIHNKFINKLTVFAVTIIFMQACTGPFDDINKNPYEVTDEEMAREGYSLGSALVGMQNFVIPTNLYLHQFAEGLAGCEYGGYVGSPNQWTKGCFSSFNATPDWVLAPFNNVIGWMYPYYDQIRALTDEPLPLALAQLYRVAAMHRVTDMYGPIPYSKMGSLGSEGGEDGKDVDALTSPYDSQKDVYEHMLEDLDKAIEVLTQNSSVLAFGGKYDYVYQGNVRNWVKFANSMKLRIAMRLYYANPTLSKQKAEEAVNHSIGVITSNSENAYIKGLIENPVYMQSTEWKDALAGADIIAYMNGYNDPRRAAYFVPIGSNYIGLRTGITSTNKESLQTTVSVIACAKTDPIMWMNAAEVAFLKAEGALHGWNMGKTAANLYNEGIELSMQQYKIDDATTNNYKNNTGIAQNYTYSPNTAYNYINYSTITVKWDEAASEELKLERIITQKWIAIFPLGNEAWAEFRRTGYPKLSPPGDNKSGGSVPADGYAQRIPYPISEYVRNRENVRNAVQLLNGADNYGTKLWWNKK